MVNKIKRHEYILWLIGASIFALTPYGQELLIFCIKNIPEYPARWTAVCIFIIGASMMKTGDQALIKFAYIFFIISNISYCVMYWGKDPIVVVTNLIAIYISQGTLRKYWGKYFKLRGGKVS